MRFLVYLVLFISSGVQADESSSVSEENLKSTEEYCLELKTLIETQNDIRLGLAQKILDSARNMVDSSEENYDEATDEAKEIRREYYRVRQAFMERDPSLKSLREKRDEALSRFDEARDITFENYESFQIILEENSQYRAMEEISDNLDEREDRLDSILKSLYNERHYDDIMEDNGLRKGDIERRILGSSYSNAYQEISVKTEDIEKFEEIREELRSMYAEFEDLSIKYNRYFSRDDRNESDIERLNWNYQGLFHVLREILYKNYIEVNPQVRKSKEIRDQLGEELADIESEYAYAWEAFRELVEDPETEDPEIRDLQVKRLDILHEAKSIEFKARLSLRADEDFYRDLKRVLSKLERRYNNEENTLSRFCLNSN